MSEHDVQPLDWDTPVDQDSLPFMTFPDGTRCTFEVVELEKTRTSDGRFPMAKITLMCTANDEHGEEGQTKVYENLVLNTKCAWKLGEFFRAIGQRQHGERVVPNWDAVDGATGRATLAVEEWTDRHGDTRTSNRVKRFLDPEDVGTAEAAAAPEDNLSFG